MKEKVQFNDREACINIYLKSPYNYIEFTVDNETVQMKKTSLKAFDINNKTYYLRALFNRNEKTLKYRVYLENNKHYEVSLSYRLKKICTGYCAAKKKPVVQGFCRNTIIPYIYKNDIINNLKLVINKEKYDNNFCEIILESFQTKEILYKLTKHDIKILKCYKIIYDYIYIDLVYIPDLYAFNINVNIISKSKYTAADLYFEIAEKNKKPMEYGYILRNLYEMDVDNFCEYMNDNKFRDLKIICLSNVSNTFLLIKYFIQVNIPDDILQIIESYLPKKDHYYSCMLAAIFPPPTLVGGG